MPTKYLLTQHGTRSEASGYGAIGDGITTSSRIILGAYLSEAEAERVKAAILDRTAPESPTPTDPTPVPQMEVVKIDNWTDLPLDLYVGEREYQQKGGRWGKQKIAREVAAKAKTATKETAETYLA